ncbi:MAG: DUF1194 domain-containing protein [Alphaproteobacteria bacterium]
MLAAACSLMLIIATSPVGAPAVAQEAVDLELVLAVDISGSIDEAEARLQRRGYIAALTDERVITAIQAGILGRIAVAYVEWGGEDLQQAVVDWRIIHDRRTARAFAAELDAARLTVNASKTSISAALRFASVLLSSNDFAGFRQVIDVSGDGPNNAGLLVNLARDLAVAAGITINGLPVINERPNRFGLPGLADLDRYYANCVIGGPGAFIVTAHGFGDFGAAIRRKLILEIAGKAPVNSPARPGSGLVWLSQHSADTRAPACDIGERRFRDAFGRG